MSSIINITVRFYLGSLSKQLGTDTWTVPDYSVPFLYVTVYKEKDHSIGHRAFESPLPSYITWTTFGMTSYQDGDGEWHCKTIEQMVASHGKDVVRELLEKSSGTYLGQYKDSVLTWLDSIK